MTKKPLYIQHEPGAYPKDIDWQMMTAEERGCYHSLIIFLACSDGYIPNAPESLCGLCNISIEKLKSFLRKYSHKFITKDGKISHKRVNEELIKARKSIKQKSLAGKKGMQRRYNTDTTPLHKTDITKGSKGKGREVKESKDLNKQLFDEARRLFKGTKNGLEPEYKNFTKKHKDFKSIIPLLKPAIENQIIWRNEDNKFWKNFQTWINSSCWTEERANYERKAIYTDQQKPKPLTAETSKIGIVVRND